MSSIVVIDDFQSDEAHQFMELVAEFLQKDPCELDMENYIGQIGLKGARLQKFAALITEEYEIPMSVEDFDGLKKLKEVWKWIEESYDDDHVLNPHEGGFFDEDD